MSGITRAKKLVVIAVPAAYGDRVRVFWKLLRLISEFMSGEASLRSEGGEIQFELPTLSKYLKRLRNLSIRRAPFVVQLERRVEAGKSQSGSQLRPENQEKTMRFMMLMIPKGYEKAAPGTNAGRQAVAAMMKYNESLQKAGVLPRTRWTPAALDGRARHVLRREPTVTMGLSPKPRSTRRLLDDSGEIEGRSDRVGQAVPWFGQRNDRSSPSA